MSQGQEARSPSAVVDAGDGLPMTVPALIAARAASRGDHPLLFCDDDTHTVPPLASGKVDKAALQELLDASGSVPALAERSGP